MSPLALIFLKDMQPCSFLQSKFVGFLRSARTNQTLPFLRARQLFNVRTMLVGAPHNMPIRFVPVLRVAFKKQVPKMGRFWQNIFCDSSVSNSQIHSRFPESYMTAEERARMNELCEKYKPRKTRSSLMSRCASSTI
jgi:hypothetical protein